MDDTANLGLPYIMAAQAQKHVTHNEALRSLDALVHLAVLDRDLTVPPTGPMDGTRDIVATGATGDWTGQDDRIAAWQDGAWMFYQPRDGFICWIVDEQIAVVRAGGSWLGLTGGGGSSSFVPFSQRAFVRQMSVSPVNNATLTVVSWDSEVYDTSGYWDTAAATRFTIPQTGTYLFWGYVAFNSSIGTLNFAQVQHKDVSNSVIEQYPWDIPSNGYAALASGPITATANDYLELRLYQNSGATRNLHTDGRNYFTIARVA